MVVAEFVLGFALIVVLWVDVLQLRRADSSGRAGRTRVPVLILIMLLVVFALQLTLAASRSR
ncbi:MAG: hypothetical protein HYU66_22655 [Armatimonadetes bacterium]|nr:hypothetical protein [Armatimonadota bacterium]